MPTKRFTIRPAAYINTRVRHSNLIYGTEVQYNFGKGIRHTFIDNVFAAVWYHSSNVFTYSAGIQLASFRIGFGADLNLGSFTPANGNMGGISCQVRYIAPQRSSKHKRIIPCNRF